MLQYNIKSIEIVPIEYFPTENAMSYKDQSARYPDIEFSIDLDDVMQDNMNYVQIHNTRTQETSVWVSQDGIMRNISNRQNVRINDENHTLTLSKISKSMYETSWSIMLDVHQYLEHEVRKQKA